MIGRARYGAAAAVIFAIEVLIAVFAKDGIVRPYAGDLLAIVLVYTVLRAATSLRMAPALIVTLSIALAIELSQAFDLLGRLGLGGSQLARIVLGGAFDVLDLVAYAAGGLLILAGEAMFGPPNSP